MHAPTVALAVAILLSGCSEASGSGNETDGADSDATSDAGTGGGSGGTTGSTEPPADGWESDYVDGAVRLDCSQSRGDMESAGAPSLTFGDATLFVGYEQVGDNQNPIVARFDGDTQAWCEIHETEGPDGRAAGITWNGGDVAYVVYTIVGGGTALEGKGGWISSYAPGSISGGGAKVSYVGQVSAVDGSLTAGTFIISVLSNNNVNTHSPRGPVTVLASGEVEFLGESAHKPIDADLTSMDCTDYPFDSLYRFSADLSSLVCAECTNCASQMPCS